jgi:hypothetical protein
MDEAINDYFEIAPNKDWDMTSPIRQEGETYSEYKYRMTILKQAIKLFKQGQIVSMEEHIKEKHGINK